MHDEHLYSDNAADNNKFPHLKTGLIAFSFHEQLQSGLMTLDDVVDFCVANNLDSIDPTAYYFPGYPAVPQPSVLNDFKLKAHKLGIAISGTGIKNEFTSPDASVREAGVQLTKDWIIAAARLGAPVLRVFAGPAPQGHAQAQASDWLLECLRECVAFAEDHGVIVGLKNNGDFIQTAKQCNDIVNAIGSPWFGLVIDTSNFAIGDPYQEIAIAAPHAVNWQVKKSLTVDGQKEDLDFDKLIKIISDSGYRGYVPVEAVDPEMEPRAELSELIGKITAAM